MTDPAVVLLAGGRSQRYTAGDKALAEVGGQPMCRRAVAGLPGEELVVNCRAEQRPELRDALGGLDPGFAVDPVPDRGPLAGLLTALRLTAADRAIVVACDMPYFDRATARALTDALDDAEAALVETGGHPQPLGAAYRVDPAREACETTLACGSKRLVDALARLDAALVDADSRALMNCNRPEEIDAAADALERRTPVQ
ncbi:MAG: molybdopterin-guanine dinucleotide biosynthesis protein A [Natronomonas sp.]|jgi:molybdopterin-guanine dinucleotide biosynthesis protein A